MSARTVFVTGTDTGVGKTHIAAALLRGLVAAGHTAVGYKPVASGCESTPQGRRNADALALQAAGSPGFDYDLINPVALYTPIAPHIAAADEGAAIDAPRLDAGHARLADAADWVVVEGAGGWHVPLSPTLDFAGWVAGRGWPVLMVVGMRLGCINHALLTANAITATNPAAGWIANTLAPVQPRIGDNIAALEARLPMPLRARVPCGPRRGWRLNPEAWLSRR